MATLYLIATPIGNLEDLSPRARRLLSELEVLACEDTRVTRKIFSKFEIPLPRIFFPYHDHNERASGERILGNLREGFDVGICSDAGMPAISDPGFRAVRAALDEGFDIDVIPGPSAPAMALALSGLPTSSYTFKGFPPPKQGKRRAFFAMEKDSPHTTIYFIAPFKLGTFLQEGLEELGDRQAAVCFELTKLHQKVSRGYLSDLAQTYKDTKKLKGEITVVIAGNNPKLLRPQDD